MRMKPEPALTVWSNPSPKLVATETPVALSAGCGCVSRGAAMYDCVDGGGTRLVTCACDQMRSAAVNPARLDADPRRMTRSAAAWYPATPSASTIRNVLAESAPALGVNSTA